MRQEGGHRVLELISPVDTDPFIAYQMIYLPKDDLLQLKVSSAVT
jgi:hypothetical protein